MAAVYILFSKKLNRFYIGSCKDISFRIDQHLKKAFPTSFTAKADDWCIYYLADNLSYSQARQIESHIKKMKSSKYIANLKNYPDIMLKLKLKYP
jgi:putative endonuclease